MRYLYIFILLSFVLSGCTKNNPSPIWLNIKNWTLNSNPNASGSQGELTQNLTDVWVYIDGNVIGVFELPCKVPIIVSGSCKVTLFPTIRNNGLAATKKIYPFMEPFENTMELTAGQTYTINPVTRYYKETQFWIEDFENSSVKINTDLDSSSASLNIENNSLIGAWGNYGHISLNTSNSLWMGKTSDNMFLPKSSAEVYLEIDYKNTNSILTGIQEHTISGSVVNHGGYTIATQKSNVKWKKIYIDLKDVVSNTPNAVYYRQSLKTRLDSDLNSSDVYIDNIKVVHL